MAYRNRIIYYIHYVAAKLFATSFTLLLFGFLIAGVTLFDMSKLISTKGILLLFVPYAIGYSIAVDCVVRLVKSHKTAFRLLLYIVGGHLPFFFVMGKYTVFTFIAGSVGAICAMIYLGAYSWIRRFPKYAITLSIMLSLVVGALLTFDFTVKKGWTEVRADYAYEAEFAYFHGIHAIKLNLNEGVTIRYSIDWAVRSGGYGHHVLDDNGDYVGQTISEDGAVHSFKADQSGNYSIVVTGDRLSGNFTVNWTFE